MASEIGSLYVSLNADLRPLSNAMSRAKTETRSATNDIRKNVGVAERSLGSFNKAAGSSNFRPYALLAASRSFEQAADRANLLRGALLSTTAVFGGFAAALTSNVILRYADSFTSLNNQLRSISESSGDVAARFQLLNKTATDSRASLGATATLYARLQKASPARSADTLMKNVETIQKGLQLGGATFQEAYSASIQLSQGIASDRLGGEELRAVLETPLGNELAKGLGVSIGKFREMGFAGELTAAKIFESLDKIAGSIDAQFAQSIRTVDQAIGYVDNQLTNYIGKTNETYGATRLMTSGIVAFGDNLDTIVPSILGVGAALAAVFVSRRLASVGGNIYGNLKESSDKAKASLVELKAAQDDARKGFLQTGLAASRGRAALQGKSGDVSEFSQPGERRAYEKASARVENIENQIRSANERIQQGYTRLAAVSAQASDRGLKTSAAQIQAEKELTKLINDQTAAESRRDAARRAKTLNVGGPDLGAGFRERGLKAEKEAVAGLASVERKLNSEREAFAKFEQDRQAKLSKLIEDRRGAQERLNSAERAKTMDYSGTGVDKTQAVKQARDLERKAKNDIRKLNSQIEAQENRIGEKRVAYQGRINSLVSQESDLRNKLEAARVDKSVDLGGAARERTSFLEQVAATEKKAAAEANTLSAQVAKKREEIAKRQVVINEQLTESDRRAANERITIMRSIDAEQANSAKLQEERTTAIADSSRRLEEARRGGRSNLAAQVTADAAAQRGYKTTIDATTQSMAALEKSMSPIGRTAGILRSGFLGFINVLGGPGGAALTAFTLGLGYLGLKAAEESQRVATATSLINEELQKVGRGSGGTAAAANEGIAQQQLKNEEENLQKIKDQYNNFANDIRGILTRLSQEKIGPNTYEGTAEGIRRLSTEVQSMAILLQSNGMTVAEFNKTLDEIGKDNPFLQTFIEQLKKLVPQAVDANIAVANITKRISELRGQAATPIDIILRVNRNALDSITLKTPEVPTLTPGEMESMQAEKTQQAIQKLTEEYGKSTDAKRRDAIAEDVRQKILENGGAVTEGLVQKEADRLLGLEKSTQASKKAAKEYERTAEILDRIKRTGEGAFLPEVDRQVIEQTKRIKGASEAIRQYIAAVESGNLAQAPKELLQVREELQKVAAAESYRGIIETYGTASQLAGDFADKQAQLNMLLGQGKITSEQAATAFSDYVTSFGNYKWIDDVTAAFANFAETAILDFDSIEEAASSFLRRLAEIVLQLLVIEPLMKAFRNGLSSGATGGGGSGGSGGGVSGFFSNLLGSFLKFDSGGTTSGAGMSAFGPKTKMTSLGLKADSGFGPKNFPAILEQGETVLTEDLMSRNMNLIDGLSKMGGKVMPVATGPGKIAITVDGARGNLEIMEMVQSGVFRGLQAYDQGLPEKVSGIQRNMKSRGRT